MEMFDSVLVPCPSCGTKVEAQSKSGPCVLATFDMETAPAEVLADVNRHAPFSCPTCEESFKVNVVVFAHTVLIKEMV